VDASGPSVDASTAKAEPKLLSGGNPQIPKGDGDGPVQDYITAMPGWKADVGRRLDRLIHANIDGVKKAVRWNSPFYGLDGQGWLVSYHCFTKYVKVTFLNGAPIEPPLPLKGKDEKARFFHIFEGDEIDEELFGQWLRQAAELPGWGSVP
jgi:hypothetical protein